MIRTRTQKAKDAGIKGRRRKFGSDYERHEDATEGEDGIDSPPSEEEEEEVSSKSEYTSNEDEEEGSASESNGDEGEDGEQMSALPFDDPEHVLRNCAHFNIDEVITALDNLYDFHDEIDEDPSSVAFGKLTFRKCCQLCNLVIDRAIALRRDGLELHQLTPLLEALEETVMSSIPERDPEHSNYRARVFCEEMSAPLARMIESDYDAFCEFSCITISGVISATEGEDKSWIQTNRKDIDAMVAFTSGIVERLGQQSIVRLLPNEVLRNIRQLLYEPFRTLQDILLENQVLNVLLRAPPTAYKNAPTLELLLMLSEGHESEIMEAHSYLQIKEVLETLSHYDNVRLPLFRLIKALACADLNLALDPPDGEYAKILAANLGAELVSAVNQHPWFGNLEIFGEGLDCLESLCQGEAAEIMLAAGAHTFAQSFVSSQSLDSRLGPYCTKALYVLGAMAYKNPPVQLQLENVITHDSENGHKSLLWTEAQRSFGLARWDSLASCYCVYANICENKEIRKRNDASEFITQCFEVFSELDELSEGVAQLIVQALDLITQRFNEETAVDFDQLAAALSKLSHLGDNVGSSSGSDDDDESASDQSSTGSMETEYIQQIVDACFDVMKNETFLSRCSWKALKNMMSSFPQVYQDRKPVECALIFATINSKRNASTKE
jgi:hypothetical protein